MAIYRDLQYTVGEKSMPFATNGHQRCDGGNNQYPILFYYIKLRKEYCPTEPGSRCFQSLAAFCDETQTTIAEETRSSSTYCADGVTDSISSDYM